MTRVSFNPLSHSSFNPFSPLLILTLSAGLLTGHKMTGLKMVLLDGVAHSVDSSELAFRQAAVGAMRQAFPQATPTVLEPVMNVEVIAPDEFQVSIVQDRSAEKGVLILKVS